MIKDEIEEYIKYCVNVRGMSEVTVKQKRCVMRVFSKTTGIRTVMEVDNAVFVNWMGHLAELEIGVASVNAYNSVIFAWVEYMRSTGRDVPLRREMVQRLKGGCANRKYYTREEVSHVVAGADEVTGLMIWVMFETGMRVAELARMRVGDFAGQRVNFVGKGRKRREVYVSEETLRRVKVYVERYGVRDYLWCVDAGFVTMNGAPLTVCTIRAHMKRAFSEAGFEGFYPHTLRHSFATDLQRRGASVAEIKEMMGHENIATTERYLHGFDGRLKELFDKYR